MKTAVALCICSVLFISSADVFAQGFVPSKGSGWMKFGYIYSRADNNFAGRDEQRFAPEHEDGERVPFRSRPGQVVGGTLLTHEATLDMLYSPTQDVVVGVFMPVFKYGFYSNTVNDYRTRVRRPGDIYLYSGYQLAKGERLGVTLYGKLKVPTSFKYPYTNEAIAGEGQFDASAALGGTYMLRPNLHLNGSMEFKYRFGWLGNGRDPDGLYVDPGEELHMSAGVGYGVASWLWLSAGWSGFNGTPWKIQYYDEEHPIARVERSFHAASIGAYVMFGQWVGMDGWALDMFYKEPITGEDHAVMRSGGVGLAKSF